MRIVPLLLLLIGVQFSIAQNLVLPIFNKGQWGAIDGKGKFIIQPTYQYLSYFVNGLAIVKKQNKFGIISDTGELKYPLKYDNVVRSGDLSKDNLSFYVTKKDSLYGLIDQYGNEVYDNTYTSIQFLKKNVVELRKDSVSFFYWINTGVRSKKGCTSGAVTQYNNELIVVQKDSLYTFINYSGTTILEEVFETPISYFKRDNLLFLTESTDKLLVFKDTTLLIHHTGPYHINWFSRNINLSSDSNTIFFSISKQKKIVEGPYSKLVEFDNNYLIFKNKKRGIISENGKLLIPIEYDFIQKVGKGYLVKQNQKIGWYSNSYKKTIPIQFQSIVSIDDRLYQVSNGQALGVFTENGTQLIPVEYERIEYADKVFKAYKNGTMTIITLTDNYTLESEQKFENVSYVKVDFSSLDSLNSNFNTNLQNGSNKTSHGWFLKTLKKKKKSGKTIEYERWGKKGDSNKIQIRPRFTKIETVDSLGITLAYNKSKKADNMVDINRIASIPTKNIIRIINNKSGKILGNKMGYRHILLSDFNRVNFCRAYGESSIVLLDKNFSVIRSDIRKTKKTKEGMTPVQFGKFPRILPGNGVNLSEFFYPFPFDFNSVTQDYLFNYHIVVPYSNWNFIDENGALVFDQPFAEVGQFQNSVALVKQNKWGLVNKNKIIIPLQYDTILRLGSNDMECYAVKDSLVISQYLTHPDGTPIDLPYDKVKLGYKNQIIAHKKTGWQVLDTNFNEITSGKFKGLHGVLNNYALVKRNKKLEIFTREGDRLVRTRCFNVFESIDDTLFIVGSKRRKGVINLRNQKVVPNYYNNIQVKGDSLIAQSRLYDVIYSRTGKTIRKKKDYTIQMDFSNGDVLIAKSNKSFVKTSGGRKIKLKKQRGIDIRSGKVICMGAGLYSIIDYQTDSILLQVNYDDLQFFDEDTYLFAKNVEKGLITENGRILFSSTYTSIHKIFDKYYVGLKNEKADFYDLKGKLLTSIKMYSISKEASGLVLCKSSDEWFYLNSDLIDPFYSTFQDALPFIGQYTAVKENDKWVVLHKNGTRNSLPAFSKLIPVKNEVFYAESINIWGLYNKSGQKLLDCKFESIEYLEDGKFKLIRNGKIGYYHATKGWIYNPFELPH